jgi:CBS domain-containing protein
MSLNEIMLSDPQTVGPEDTVPTAFRLMKKFGMRNLPVVDGDGCFLGVFSTVHLIELLLPVAATVEGGLTDLSFVHDSLDDIRERYQNVENHKVGDFIESEHVPVVHTETSLVEAMLLLYKHRTHVTVVEESTNKVVGVITVNGILEALMGAD